MSFVAVTLFVFLCASRDFVSCDSQTLMDTDTVLVELGDSITLICTYNCSFGFVRGYWRIEEARSRRMPVEINTNCTLNLTLKNITIKDLKTYFCYSEISDSTQIQPKTERVVLLKLKEQAHAVTHITETTKVSLQSESNILSVTEQSGINDVMKVSAGVAITVVLVLATLAVYLCTTRRRQRHIGKKHQPANMPNSPRASSTSLSLIQEPTSKQSERVKLRIPTPEMQGDPEVAYADIVISVRGASTPDISQAFYFSSAGRREWSRGGHLQAARSADTLHVPRQVGRKMSTSSDYAVITYA